MKMKIKSHILVYILLAFSLSVFSQQAKQKKADTLFSQYSFLKAVDLYKELVDATL